MGWCFCRARAIECIRDALHAHNIIGLRPKLRASPYKDLAEIRSCPRKLSGNHGKGKQNITFKCRLTSSLTSRRRPVKKSSRSMWKPSDVLRSTWTETIRDKRSFLYKVVSIQVYSVQVSIVPRIVLRVLGFKNEEYSPKKFFMFTRKLYLYWSKFLCNFTAWVRIETTFYQPNSG